MRCLKQKFVFLDTTAWSLTVLWKLETGTKGLRNLPPTTCINIRGVFHSVRGGASVGFKLSSVKLVDSIVILDVTHTFFLIIPNMTDYAKA